MARKTLESCEKWEVRYWVPQSSCGRRCQRFSTGRFALDGFGGQSANLVSLRDFAIDVVKLDCGLVYDALLSARSLSLLVAILGLAEQIGVEVIAKGIETMAQHELLLHVGCRYAQGFLYSPPLPLAKLRIGARIHVGVALAASF